MFGISVVFLSVRLLVAVSTLVFVELLIERSVVGLVVVVSVSVTISAVTVSVVTISLVTVPIVVRSIEIAVCWVGVPSVVVHTISIRWPIESVTIAIACSGSISCSGSVSCAGSVSCSDSESFLSIEAIESISSLSVCGVSVLAAGELVVSSHSAIAVWSVSVSVVTVSAVVTVVPVVMMPVILAIIRDGLAGVSSVLVVIVAMFYLVHDLVFHVAAMSYSGL